MLMPKKSVGTKEEKVQEIKYIDFRDVPFQDRLAAINEKVVVDKLLMKMPERIEKTFIDYFLNPPLRGKMSKEDDRFQELYKYFSDPEISVVADGIINVGPSSHEALQPLYNKRPKGVIDEYFFNCLAGDAIPKRLDAVVEKIPEIIRKIFNEKGMKKVNILIPGSGPGQDIIRILSENPDIQNLVGRIICVDNASSAIKDGQAMAKNKGVNHLISYEENSLMELAYQEIFDLILVVGVICPLPNDISGIVLKQIATYGNENVVIVVSAAKKSMLVGDPVTTATMDIGGWRLDYKIESDFEDIFSKSGLKEIGYFYEDQKNAYHRISITKKNKN